MTLFEDLAAPFDAGELKFFPVALSRDKQSGRVGSYIDARCVQERLDKVVPGQWMTAFRCIDPMEKAVECTLSLRVDSEWVSRADVGYPNDAKDAENPEKEPWKAAYSDAFKRAAVQWGIGRYIYSLELVKDWLPVDQYGKFTEQPRLKHGAAQQGNAPSGANRAAGQERSGASSSASVRPPNEVSAPAAPPAQKGLFQVTLEMGYGREEVTALSQRMFDNREPRQLNADEKRRLVLALEEAKKEPVGA